MIGWVVEGEQLKVKNRIINVTQCQITFQPQKLSFSEPVDDAIESVEFWFSYPVAKASLYVYSPGSGLLEPYTPDKAGLPQHYQWLLRYTGKTARTIRLLYRELTQPAVLAQ